LLLIAAIATIKKNGNRFLISMIKSKKICAAEKKRLPGTEEVFILKKVSAVTLRCLIIMPGSQLTHIVWLNPVGKE
jgi:hypothetical protein